MTLFAHTCSNCGHKHTFVDLRECSYLCQDWLRDECMARRADKLKRPMGFLFEDRPLASTLARKYGFVSKAY